MTDGMDTGVDDGPEAGQAPALPVQPDRIETQRLVLRRFREDDAGGIAAHLAPREMAWNLGRVPHPYCPADALAFLSRTETTDTHAVTLRDGTLIGSCGMSVRSPGNAADGAPAPVCVTLGYWIGQGHWGHGYAPEAVAAKLFEHFGRGGGTVHARAFQDNPRSLAVLRHAGFRLVGEASDRGLARGVDAPVWLTACAAQDFRDAPWNRAVMRENAA